MIEQFLLEFMLAGLRDAVINKRVESHAIVNCRWFIENYLLINYGVTHYHRLPDTYHQKVLKFLEIKHTELPPEVVLKPKNRVTVVKE